jgi:transcriptional regulator with XRE-family HTH domain
MESTQKQGLKELRDAKGLTQEELAGKVGVRANTVSRWELMQHAPHPAFHKSYAKALDITVEALRAIVYGHPAKQL